MNQKSQSEIMREWHEYVDERDRFNADRSHDAVIGFLSGALCVVYVVLFWIVATN